MKPHSRLSVPRWLLFVGGVLLVAGHVGFLRYALPHVRLSQKMLAILIVLIVIKHLGAFGTVYVFLRRRLFRRDEL